MTKTSVAALLEAAEAFNRAAYKCAEEGVLVQADIGYGPEVICMGAAATPAAPRLVVRAYKELKQ